MKYDINCGACIRAQLAEAGIGCVSLDSAISVFLTGKDTHSPTCKADKDHRNPTTNERNGP